MTKSRRRITALLTAAVAAMALAAPAVSDARIGEVKSFSQAGNSATVQVTDYWRGNVWWKYSSGSYCVYVQYKHTAYLGLDGTWNRLTANSCNTTQRSMSFYLPTNRAFNALKFRLCQSRNNQLDSCGNDVQIGMSR
jgi:hypothetical protein